MNNLFRLTHLHSDELSTCRYDLMIAAHGYEARATAVSKAMLAGSEKRFAFGFNHNLVASYEENHAWFSKNGFTMLSELSSEDFSRSLGKILAEYWDTKSKQSSTLETKRIAIDVSCFDRTRLAEIICAFQKAPPGQRFELDFWYNIARFEPPHASLGRNEIAGPVHRRFAGKFTDPGRPLALIAGLGYELGRVMGAAEYLQASRVIALFPESPIAAYAPEVTKANKILLNDLQEREVVRYPVDDPVRTIANLESVVKGLLHSHNVVMLPGGPKIFVLACLLVQLLYPTTAVWRVSSGSSIPAKDIKPSSYFVGLRLSDKREQN